MASTPTVKQLLLTTASNQALILANQAKQDARLDAIEAAVKGTGAPVAADLPTISG
ncbi:hypothetical protein [Muricoccus aerilatus]|uniref:hypothetical protein n=1 Tax=Muricoccus aerilatus TaxID=452982 RepID=UPI000B07967B|nr:hypothetical protein [Roseomonas aerilata]